MQHTDRVALVTVAGQGIGPASACLLETPIHQEAERRDVEEVRTLVESLEGEMPPAGKPGSSGPVARLVLSHASDALDHITGVNDRRLKATACRRATTTQALTRGPRRSGTAGQMRSRLQGL
jgi:hypothetical protein